MTRFIRDKDGEKNSSSEEPINRKQTQLLRLPAEPRTLSTDLVNYTLCPQSLHP